MCDSKDDLKKLLLKSQIGIHQSEIQVRIGIDQSENEQHCKVENNSGENKIERIIAGKYTYWAQEAKTHPNQNQ